MLFLHHHTNVCDNAAITLGIVFSELYYLLFDSFSNCTKKCRWETQRKPTTSKRLSKSTQISSEMTFQLFFSDKCENCCTKLFANLPSIIFQNLYLNVLVQFNFRDCGKISGKSINISS